MKSRLLLFATKYINNLQIYLVTILVFVIIFVSRKLINNMRFLWVHKDVKKIYKMSPTENNHKWKVKNILKYLFEFDLSIPFKN